MQKIKVVGVGPGSANHLTPEAAAAIQTADIVVGARRHLDSFAAENQEKMILNNHLDKMVEFIQSRRNQRIVVVASGDPGLYGILKYLLRHFDPQQIEVVPGISSIQLAFAKLAMPWEDAILLSAHGRSVETIEKLLEESQKVAILTGSDNPPVKIFEMFSQKGIRKTFYLCFDLSLPGEAIIRLQAGDDFPEEYIERHCCVMVVINE